MLIDEPAARDREYVLIEPDGDAASELHEAKYRVIHGDPESTAVLENARISSASAVVADADDDTNASIALAARDADSDVRVISLIEDATVARYQRLAGVETVLSPRQLLGQRLASEATAPTMTTVEERGSLGDDLELAELFIEAESDLSRETFGEARVRERFGVDVIGMGIDDAFVTSIGSNDTLAEETRLLVVGKPDRLDALRDAATTGGGFPPRRVVLAGYGDTGQAADEALADTRLNRTVVDIEEKDGVDVVGDASDPAVLTEAGINEASALLLTVRDDTTAVFATLIARDLDPDLQIFVRANDEADVQKSYLAGADYVQSLPTGERSHAGFDGARGRNPSHV